MVQQSMISLPLGEAFEAISSGADVMERWRHLLEFFGRHGADQVNYAVLDTLSFERECAPVTNFSSMDAGWIKYYLENRLDLHDPHVRFVRERRHLPYRWNAKVAAQLADNKEQEVIALAAEAGLRSQINVIVEDPVGGRNPIGGMSIGSSNCDDDYFRSISGKESLLLTVALLFHNQNIGEIRREQVDAKPLTSRERDCLTFVALGLRTTSIAERLHISEVTVEMHLRNARHKLRAATTAQAVARAMTFGDVVI